MTTYKLAAVGAAAALFVLLGGSIAVADQPAQSVCQTWNPTKAGPAVTHCVTWAHRAAPRPRAANCDPSTLGGAAMRAKCAATTGDDSTPVVTG
jgi:hypothetical protein